VAAPGASGSSEQIVPTRNRRLLVLLGIAALVAVILAVRHFSRGEQTTIEKALSGETDQRVEAIRKVADSHAPVDAEVLLNLTRDPDTRVAVESCLAIGRMRCRSWCVANLPRVAAAAADERAEVREAAVVSIGMLGGKSSRKLLLEKLKNDPSPEVQAASADALGRIRSLDAMPALLDLLDSPSENVRRSAALAITKIWMRDYGFKADDPPEKRRALIKGIRAAWDWYVQGPAYPYLKAKTEERP
jgi:hypothetical protein